MKILPSGFFSSVKKYLVYLLIGLLTFGITFAALTFLLPEGILDKIKIGGDLKSCNQEQKAEEKATTFNGKVVLRVRDKESQLLDLVSNKKTTIDTKDDDPIIYFSSNGNYIVYIQELRPKSGKLIKNFFFYNTTTGSKKKLKTNFKISGDSNPTVTWSNDNKQFIISQGGKAKKGSTDFEYWVDYFNVSDLVPRKATDLAKVISKTSVFISKFPKENEIIVSENKSTNQNLQEGDGKKVKYEFSKVSIPDGDKKSYKNFSFKLPLGASGHFSPDYKYYFFVEKESWDVQDIPKSDDELSNLKKLKVYIGYVNLEANCMKKIEITDIPFYFNSSIEIEQFSEDSKKVLLKINSIDFATNSEIIQWWRMDIATLTKSEKGVSTTINGDQINSIVRMSSHLNFAIVTTLKGKYYLLDLRNGKATLITADPTKVSPYSFWLKETTN